MEMRFGNWMRQSWLYRLLKLRFGFCWHNFGDWQDVGCYRPGPNWSTTWINSRQERRCPWCRKLEVRYFPGVSGTFPSSTSEYKK